MSISYTVLALPIDVMETAHSFPERMRTAGDPCFSQQQQKDEMGTSTDHSHTL
jgi:hypothetical protein